ncbi:anthranilate synthase (plasmid) [Burkholderia ubonensis]|uniref:anthranilate synthase n=1 Tax=Burkholderia ubonensis TaxID=101571 RepID=A0A103R186_9BURK|nr:anthranilate synthase family protein [Burkholderia ubonensis]AOJ64625.1 anthranilate synthase [Burkholderia ubonensis]KVG59351.1 anthranilate synthase [Burkholderia ubonensis]
MNPSLLDDIVSGNVNHGAFALLLRSDPDFGGTLDVLAGDLRQYETLASVPLPDGADAGDEVLLLVPYCQLRERRFACRDDGERLRAMTVRRREHVDVAEALKRLPDAAIVPGQGEFDIDDDAYAAIVREVITDEIGRGEGSNFVIRRTFVTELSGYSTRVALAAFRRLVEQEVGAHWTFIVHTGDRTFIGASPERHISLRDGVVTMNPISGTYRYPASGPTLDGVMAFLSDPKEKDELYMVVDEELKMMAHFCPQGGRVIGPYLKEMSRLAHTEYFIEGHTSSDPREILLHTLFAPTVTGSPIENACRVIAKHEPAGRAYYGGVVALIGRDADARFSLDSAIQIRTADIDAHGRARIGVGSTIVRHSDPRSEASETRAKAIALLTALGQGGRQRLGEESRVCAALNQRNYGIAGFWLAGADERIRPDPELRGRKVLMIDAEDAFTAMLSQQLSAVGLDVTTCRCDERDPFERDWDLIVMGPGPGDPRSTQDQRIASMRSAIGHLLRKQIPFFAVCLSHQILCLELGLEIEQRAIPNQGVQREIDYFGHRERVGFYNTYSAKCDHDEFALADGTPISVCRDVESGEVHGLRGRYFSSIQFHAESLLTQRGVDILSSNLKRILVK